MRRKDQSRLVYCHRHEALAMVKELFPRSMVALVHIAGTIDGQQRQSPASQVVFELAETSLAGRLHTNEGFYPYNFCDNLAPRAYRFALLLSDKTDPKRALQRMRCHRGQH
mmetsp:Transcript_9590/g.16840  ORF Transcript_9590/g.16840 Transcript_9590/m.16840 type:complete len:111 (-) Transcript_9590:1569-1901(-)